MIGPKIRRETIMPKRFQFSSCLTILVVLVVVVLVDATASQQQQQQKGVNNDGGSDGGLSPDASLLHAAKQAFPLRDDRDYESLTNDDEYDDEDYDQTEYGDDKLDDLNGDGDDEDDGDDHDGGFEGNNNDGGDDDDDVQRHIGRPNSDHQTHRGLGKATAKPYSVTSTSLFCPEKCSCLGEFIECKNLNLQLPRIPSSVQDLELSHNNLGDARCEQSIGNLTSLVKLRLKHNQLTKIPIFVGLNALNTLILSNNDIQSISKEALLAIPQLAQLDLSRNSIKAILPNSFPPGNVLGKINLNHNEITNLDKNSLAGAQELVDLKLNHNRIRTLPAGIFLDLRKLKRLSLSGNQLGESIQWATFSNLSSLISLKLRNNFIKELITGVFHGLNNLSILDLASNELTEIQKGGLLNLTALTKLSLANNSIESIGSSCWEFSQKIQHLDLAGNRLANLSVNTFEHLSKLKQLDLRHNAIATIAGGTFNTTPNLHTLDLGHNQISWTIEDMHGPFAPLKLLDRLNLNDNEIKSVNQHAFAGLKALTWLDLTNNNLTSVQFNAFETKTTPQLKHLQINSNDLICDCNMLWFFTWLRKVSGIRRAQAVTMNYGGEGAAKRFGNGDKNDARCAYPATLRGKRLLELHKNNLTCNETPKPRIIDEPETQILALKGTIVVLNCTAASTSNSRITFKWKHDNVDVKKEFVETVLNRKPKNPQQRRTNRARREIGDSASLPMGPAGLKYDRYASDEDSDDGDDTDGDDNERNDEQPDHQIPLPPNSTVAVSHVTLANVDHQHSGRYQCIATNRFGTTYSQKFKVTVASYPKFTKQPNNVTVQASSTVRLDCAVDGDPKPQIYWQFNFGNDFPAARERRMHVMPEDDAFFIVQAKASDQGVYTCTADNPAGIIRANATVQVLEAPAFVKPMENKEVLIGESSVLECMKTGSPSPTLRWYKEGPGATEFTQIEPTDRHFFTAEDQLLIIVKTTEADAGTYKCEMENKIDKISATMKLLVRSVADSNRGGQMVNVDEMTCIVIITVVCCAVGTSIIWVVIIYQTRKETSCTNLMSSNGGTGGMGPAISNDTGFVKVTNPMAANTTSTLMIGDGGTLMKSDMPQSHSLRTATINGRGVTRSASRSSVGGFDDTLFRKYPGLMPADDEMPGGRNPIHPGYHHRHPAAADSDDDEHVHDDEALLGTAYFGINGPCFHQPRKRSHDINSSDSNVTSPSITKDNSLMRSRDCVDTTTITTNTDDCDLNDKRALTAIPKTTNSSLSMASSCESIPPLPYNASNDMTNGSNSTGTPCNNSLSSGSVSSSATATPPLTTFQVDREHQQNLLNQQRVPLLTSNNNSPARSIYRDKSASPVAPPLIQPKVHVPIPPRKPNIQTNKLNELVATLNK